ncbi:MAG: aminomethyltransferase family protein [Pseudomonadota bacterium]
MTTQENLKITPLNQWHKQAFANMADFGGFEMPLWYPSGVKTEHLSVLHSAGLFDTSHMSSIMVIGDKALELLNFCFTRNIQALLNGRCAYGAFLSENGHCIDDAIVYKFSNTVFMVCVNAGMGQTITRHLQDHCPDDTPNYISDETIDIIDLSGQIAKIDIQGKNSARILSHVIQSPEMVFSKMSYFSFKGLFDLPFKNTNVSELSDQDCVRLKDGTPLLLSRSGYTGEFGFEIFIQSDAVVSLWMNLLSLGKEMGITACGLGARDSLRAGACLPLSHQDIGDWKFINHPWEFALPFNETCNGFTKSFLGSDALLFETNDSFIYPYVGDSLRKVGAGKNTRVIHSSGNDIGFVLTCATDMAITWVNDQIISINSKNISDSIPIKGISCGFVHVSQKLETGSRLTLVDGKRNISICIVNDIRPDRTARRPIKEFI